MRRMPNGEFVCNRTTRAEQQRIYDNAAAIKQEFDALDASTYPEGKTIVMRTYKFPLLNKTITRPVRSDGFRTKTGVERFKWEAA